MESSGEGESAGAMTGADKAGAEAAADTVCRCSTGLERHASKSNSDVHATRRSDEASLPKRLLQKSAEALVVRPARTSTLSDWRP